MVIVELGGGNNPRFCGKFGNGVNIDKNGGLTVDIVSSLEEEIPLPNEYAEIVYSAFAIEHLSWRKVKNFISEIYRILKHDGRVIIITANLLEQAKAVVSKKEWDGTESNLIFGGQDYPDNTHKCGFSPEYITKLLSEVGFIKIAVSTLANCATDMVIEGYKDITKVAKWANNYEIKSKIFSDIKEQIFRLELNCKIYPSAKHWSRKWEYPWALTNADLRKEDIVLNAGSGVSGFSLVLAQQSKKVILIDNNEETVNKNQALINTYKINNVTSEFGDIKHLSYYPDNYFDKVFCISVLEHTLPPHNEYLNELHRVLKPNGRLLLTFDIIDTPTIDQHLTTEELPQLLKVFDMTVPNSIPTQITGILPNTTSTLKVIGVMVKKHE